MVWSRERDTDHHPLSVILPQLYLGAESDVTQLEECPIKEVQFLYPFLVIGIYKDNHRDRLASLDISYVLSVSRCSPQPSFLPPSRYLRIPIDDSLWDNLLPWIPQALHFIDAAMSSGASVLVHCAAGISRSPALAVAYIMYSLEMDLDHAYRFVKERRPSISPNFNFLGQLQHFQGALSQKTSGGDFIIHRLDNHLPSMNDRVSYTHGSQNHNYQVDSVTGDSAQLKDKTQQKQSLSDANRNHQQRIETLDLTVCQNPQHVQTRCEIPASNPCEPIKAVPKHTKLQFPSSTASLLEKRKSLSLALTPLGMCPLSKSSSSEQARGNTISKTVHDRETEEKPEAKTLSHTGRYRQERNTHMEQSPSHSKCSRAEVKEQGLLSPLSFTLNKLLGWGERVLLGGLFVHPVRMGQPTLPYRC